MQTPQDRLEFLIADRLEHLVDRVEWLVANGQRDDAEVLKYEGLMLAEAYDNGENFFAIDTVELLK
jgi:hypothetical protein